MPYIGNTTSDFSIDTGNITNRAVTATKLSPSSVGSNGQVLSVDGSGNLQWSTDSNAPEGTSVLSTGESGTSKYLRVDGDGTCSWQSAVDTTKIPLTGGTFSGDVSFFGGATNVIIHYDASDNALEFWDGTKASFGSDEDLLIYHDNSAGYSFIKAPNGRVDIRADNFQLVSDDSSGRAIYLNNSGGHLELGFDGGHDAQFTGTGVTFLTDLTIPDKIIHSGDTDTAIRFPSADTFTVETAGTERLRIDSSGNGSIGGITAAPTSTAYNSGTLHLHQATGAASGGSQLKMTTSQSGSAAGDGAYLAYYGNNELYIYNKENADISFGTNATERLRIKADGQVWIGGASGVTGSFTNTTWNLSVTNSSGDSYALIAGTTGAALELRDTVTSESVVLAANGDCNLYSYKAGDSIKFHNTPSGGSVTERIAIASTGQITYSAASGDNQITSKRTNAAGSNGNYFFHLAAKNSDDNVVGGLGFHRDSATDDSRFIVDTRTSGGTSTERVRIDSTGRVGINGAGTKGMLEVRASGGDPAQLTAVFGANEGTTNGTLTDNTDKACRIGIQNYDTDAKPFAFLVGSSTNGVNTLNIGGGTSLMNGATEIKFSTDVGQVNNGGTERLSISDTGVVHAALYYTAAAIPCFKARCTGINDKSFGQSHGSTYWDINYLAPMPTWGANSTVVSVFNQGSHMTTTNWTPGAGGNQGGYIKFTAPVAGVYYFYIGAAQFKVVNNDWCGFGLMKNTTAESSGDLDAYLNTIDNLTGDWDYFGSTGSTTMDLAANDYVILYVRSASQTTVWDRCEFGGHLLG